MDMINTHAGKLRAIGYDASKQALRVTLEDGNTFEYANVSESVWRSFKSASAQWSYYRDHIEETYRSQRVASPPVTPGNKPGTRNPLDDLFG